MSQPRFKRLNETDRDLEEKKKKKIIVSVRVLPYVTVVLWLGVQAIRSNPRILSIR